MPAHGKIKLLLWNHFPVNVQNVPRIPMNSDLLFRSSKYIILYVELHNNDSNRSSWIPITWDEGSELACHGHGLHGSKKLRMRKHLGWISLHLKLVVFLWKKSSTIWIPSSFLFLKWTPYKSKEVSSLMDILRLPFTVSPAASKCHRVELNYRSSLSLKAHMVDKIDISG